MLSLECGVRIHGRDVYKRRSLLTGDFETVPVPIEMGAKTGNIFREPVDSLVAYNDRSSWVMQAAAHTGHEFGAIGRRRRLRCQAPGCRVSFEGARGPYPVSTSHRETLQPLSLPFDRIDN